MKGKPSQITVMALDPDPLVHMGLEALLSQRPKIQLVGTANTYQDALGQLEKSSPDVLLTEVTLPDRSGAEACRDVIEAYPGTRVLFLALYQEQAAVYSSLLAGASGFLLKESARERLPNSDRNDG